MIAYDLCDEQFEFGIAQFRARLLKWNWVTPAKSGSTSSSATQHVLTEVSIYTHGAYKTRISVLVSKWRSCYNTVGKRINGASWFLHAAVTMFTKIRDSIISAIFVYFPYSSIQHHRIVHLRTSLVESMPWITNYTHRPCDSITHLCPNLTCVNNYIPEKIMAVITYWSSRLK